jgi:O-acetyl-ADP-ribose deacetylase (regulator of RNase III)
VKDSEGNIDEVNKNVERIGYNIGMRIIEDYLARGGPQAQTRCTDIKDTAEKCQVGYVVVTMVTTRFRKYVVTMVTRKERVVSTVTRKERVVSIW